MLTKLKIIGLTAIAALAVSAVVATAAQANPQFHVESAPATITGEQSTQLQSTFTSGSFSCGTATLHGVSSVATATTLTVSPAYSGCTLFGFLNVALHMNGCSYVLDLTTNTTNPYTAGFAISCPAGKAIETTGPFGCVVSIGSQSRKGLSVGNNGVKISRSLTVAVNVANLTYTENTNCPYGEGNFANGAMHGSLTVRAYTGSGSQQGLWVA
jgi:hypothetical protein